MKSSELKEIKKYWKGFFNDSFIYIFINVTWILILTIWLVLFFPLQMICWLFNKKEFKDTYPYKFLLKFLNLVGEK